MVASHAASTDGIDSVLDAVLDRLTSTSTSLGAALALSASEGLHLGSPLRDPRFLADSTCSVTRLESRVSAAGRDRGSARVEDRAEIELCWSVSAASGALRREALRSAQRKAEQAAHLLTERSGFGPSAEGFARRWNPRVNAIRERLVLWADGHAEFVVITLEMAFSRDERRGS